MSDQYIKGLVSVITPVYNTEKYIEETINSVLNQTYQKFECILVDDCSSDKSAEIIKKIAEKDSRVKYFKNEKNSGAAVSRNRALKEAKGQYVAFLDADDIWLPNKLKRELSLMKHKNAFFVFGAIEMIDSEGRVIKGRRNIPAQINYKGLLKNTAIATSTVLIDRNVTGAFQMPDRRSGQDYATWLMLLRGNKTAYAVRNVVTRYRKDSSSGSLSAKKTKNWKKVYDIQVNYEHINPIEARINCLFYIGHAVIKYYF